MRSSLHHLGDMTQRGCGNKQRSGSQLRRSRMFIDSSSQTTSSSFRSEMSEAEPCELHCAPKGARASLTNALYKHCIPTGCFRREFCPESKTPGLSYKREIRRFVLAIITLLLAAAHSYAQPKVTIDHNSNKTATADYKFPRVPSPARNDAGAQALWTLVDAEADGNSADISALNDGVLPTSEDQPRRNFFLNTGSGGGRLKMDLGSVMEVSQVNSYSWHTGSRGPQVYRLWASDGMLPNFNAEPKGDLDPAACGWISIVIVDTRTDEADGGQYGVSITDARGVLGKFRYLLFDLYPTEI